MKLKKKQAAGIKAGFTLIELMIVLIILGLLTALVTPQFLGKAEKAKRQTAKMQIEYLSNAVKDYYLDVGQYPQQLKDLVENPGEEKWDGPYLDPPKIPEDPWGEEYVYEYPGTHGQFDLYSWGSDRAPGGEDNNADIVSWE